MTEPESLKRTPLYDIHVQHGARLTPFAGFEMPIQYSGIIDEHMAVRQAAGIFDVSHMGEFIVRGRRAFEYVQRLVTNDASKLHDGKAMYTVMCRQDGGIVDDLLVYRLAEEKYMLVINAANIDKDLNWMRQYLIDGAELEDVSGGTALIAIQGPQSFSIVRDASGIDLHDLKFYHFKRIDDFLGHDGVIVSHTGYTGERGLEIYCRPEAAADIWTALVSAGTDRGLKPCGLGARDTLRVEAGFSLYGNDITDETNPLEAGLGWLVKLNKDAFIGKAALEEIKSRGLSRRMIGFVVEERGIPRTGFTITNEDGQEIGSITSGTQSPILAKGIGMGYVANEERYTREGARLLVQSRGRALRATVRKPPFHKN